MSETQSQAPALHTPSGLAVRRAVTVPTRLLPLDARSTEVEIGSTEGVETLFVHPYARIVSFTTGPSLATSSPSKADPESPQEAGTLSWTSPTERTLALGPLEIYRVPGSVSFLHSGSLLHAILPRSQCWCVDGVSVFTFRVLPNQYYRIELPGKTEADLRMVEEMKVTLQKVLHYERTACPFRRGFSVDLPEAPQVKKQARPKSMMLPAKKWKKRDIWRPEDDESWNPAPTPFSTPEVRRPQLQTQEITESASADRPLSRCSAQSISDDGNDFDLDTPKPSRVRALVDAGNLAASPSADDRRHGQSSTKANDIVTVGSRESIGNGPDAGVSQEVSSPQEAERAAEPVRASQGSPPASPPKTPQEHIHDPLQSPMSQAADLGGFSEDDVVEGRIWSGIDTPSLSSGSEENSWGEVNTPPEAIRMRRRQKPFKATEAATPKPRPSLERRKSPETSPALRDSIVRKTVGMVLGPPAHLVTLMLKIAGKFSNGAFNFTIRSPVGAPQKIPGSWYLGDDEDEWELDDYGFTVGIPGSAQRRALSRSASRAN